MKKLPDGVVPGKTMGEGGKRGVITEFSDESRLRLLHVIKNCAVAFRSMATITYPAEFPSNGRTVKRHLMVLAVALRRRFPGIAGVWFLEFQKRGAPHFHLIFNLDLSAQGLVVEKTRRHRDGVRRKFFTVESVHEWLSETWFRIVGSGDEKHLRAGASWEVIEHAEGALRYAAKHAAKCHQKHVPEGYADVGRFWGKIGDVVIPRPEVEPISAEELMYLLGPDAVISSKGRVRKYLWDAASKMANL